MPLILAGLVFAAVCGFALASNPSDAGAARAKIFGKTPNTPNPSCPGNCQVQARVTGFQKSVDGKRGIFRVKQTGHIVAWSVDLSRPNKRERNFFEDNLSSADFGSRPTARLSIIKKTDRQHYKLTKQTPVVELMSSLGQSPIFTLTDPLRVRSGEVVALTVPTWLPNFAHERVSRDNAWVGSRGSKKCEGEENLLEKSKPHQKVDSVRKYGCVYRGARLLYRAYFVPS
ncbi:MAG TPA: hypothetical protein VHJ54_11710 [Solirubrobacterales bacterium]|jgi:hypothetical protein|nr:hypothetical protein [Solirubrobacterales bacterium]